MLAWLPMIAVTLASSNCDDRNVTFNVDLHPDKWSHDATLNSCCGTLVENSHVASNDCRDRNVSHVEEKWSHDAVFTSFFGTPTAELRCCLDAAFLVVGEAICLDMSPTKKGSKSPVKAADAQTSALNVKVMKLITDRWGRPHNWKSSPNGNSPERIETAEEIAAQHDPKKHKPVKAAEMALPTADAQAQVDEGR